MALSRLLPLLLLVPALTMADEDKNFKVTSDYFKVGSVLDHPSKVAIVMDSALAISQEPVFPLQRNKLYLRYKNSVKEYLWFSGDVKLEDYKQLHAFSLKDNHLGVREVFGLRLYASRQYKAFQDEAEIYFDTEYIYSPRVSKLLFMKNGKWQVLEESPHPGIVQIKSNEKNLEITSYKTPIKGTRAIYPASEGFYSFAFSAPDKLPYVDAGNLKRGGSLVLNVEFPVLDSTTVAPMEFSVKPDQIKSLTKLEDAEAFYDAFTAEVDKNVTKIDMTEFANVYPALKPADSLGVVDSSADYRGYVAHYNLKRTDAQKLWREKKLGQVSSVYKSIHAKLDSLQQFPLQVNVKPDSMEKIMQEGDSTKVDSMRLHFVAEGGRIDVSWKGVVDSISMDSLSTLVAEGDEGLVMTLFLVNNKPVWAYKEGKLVGRYQYRYDKLGFRKGEKLYMGKGEFILPPHIAVEREVGEWFKSKTTISSSSSVASSSSSASKKGSGRIVEHSSRGTVAVIDSGSFRFRGKVVSMSPYAIHTTEVTQEFFKEIMSRVDSTKRVPDRSAFKGPKKPVQGITWEKAQYACKILGGDLPTEAQWEFAGRAGSNDGFLWPSDDVMTVNKYAVFAGNSLKMGKQDTAAYGPHNVATKLPNAWGLYDMSGNVAEWTLDNYFAFTFSIQSTNPTGSSWGTDKVLKGGSWKDRVKKLYMTERDDEDPRYWADWIGFRCAFPLDRIIQDKQK